jgi:putative SOS response-associated peptidase YedK
LRRRRCLLPASGFYEWAQAGKQKQPYLFTLRERRPFAFAGLWERWGKGGEEVLSCAILTTEANEVLRPVHNRMPVILPVDAYDRWLDPAAQNPAAVTDLLCPYPAGEMVAAPVSRRVNNPGSTTPPVSHPSPPARGRCSPDVSRRVRGLQPTPAHLKALRLRGCLWAQAATARVAALYGGNVVAAVPPRG